MNSLINAPLDISGVLFLCRYVDAGGINIAQFYSVNSDLQNQPSYRASSTFSLDDETSALSYHLRRVVMSFETLSIIRTNTPNGGRT